MNERADEKRERKTDGSTKTGLRRGRVHQASAADSGALISGDEQDFLFAAEPDDTQKAPPSP